MSVGRRTVVDWVALLLRAFLGGFYVVAGVVKIPDPSKFAEAVANYRLLPHELLNVVAITLPGIEVVAGVLLILGLWLRGSLWLINAMTLVFIAAIASAVVRGLDIDCGCFGTVGGRQVGVIALIEDAGLLACGVWLRWHYRDRGSVPPANEATTEQGGKS
ncbi:MAG: MauE/DoxX family redox-associated membrane protein [Verrucomicrobiota bacterium]